MSRKSKWSIRLSMIAQQLLISTAKYHLKRICSNDTPMWGHPVRQITLCILVTLIYMNDTMLDLNNSDLTTEMRNVIEHQVESVLGILRDCVKYTDDKSKCTFCQYKLYYEEHYNLNNKRRRNK